MDGGIAEYIAAEALRVEAALDRLLPSDSEGPGAIHRAMRYSLLAGGKRFRPVLCLASFEATRAPAAAPAARAASHGAGAAPTDDRAALDAACALEMIHTYSLIHDDLPALDNDDLRRGRATSHKVFGEATAILAGDALLTQAFEILAGAGAPAVALVARAIGTRGMIGGQVRDIDAEGKTLTLDELETMHREKTGALIAASCELGGLLAGAAARARAALADYGARVGLAFQVADDLLNVEGSVDQIGKPVGSDAARHKATFVSLLGAGAARARAHALVAEARALALRLPRGDRLAALADYSVSRVR
ncbi:MAG: polyprenyl synthetase family protein [bacterium]